MQGEIAALALLLGRTFAEAENLRAALAAVTEERDKLVAEKAEKEAKDATAGAAEPIAPQPVV